LNWKPSVVLIRGGGDLATGIAARLFRAGVQIVITEIEQPKAVRRLVSLAEAVYANQIQVEDLKGRLVADRDGIFSAFNEGIIPVIIDPEANIRHDLPIVALIDARMRKRPPEVSMEIAPMVVGIGPGFSAGVDCHAVVETQRGHRLGRVYWEGTAQADTGVPTPVAGHDAERVLRAPAPGNLEAKVNLADFVRAGDTIATIKDVQLKAPFDGVLRGLVHNSVVVKIGEKVGDLDPRTEPSYCYQISDKSLAIGGGALEAILSKPGIRSKLWK
jgi:xanthine dehydrogenase accessory factor